MVAPGLGSGGGFERLHYLLERAWDGDDLSYSFLKVPRHSLRCAAATTSCAGPRRRPFCAGVHGSLRPCRWHGRGCAAWRGAATLWHLRTFVHRSSRGMRRQGCEQHKP